MARENGYFKQLHFLKHYLVFAWPKFLSTAFPMAAKSRKWTTLQDSAAVTILLQNGVNQTVPLWTFYYTVKNFSLTNVTNCADLNFYVILLFLLLLFHSVKFILNLRLNLSSLSEAETVLACNNQPELCISNFLYAWNKTIKLNKVSLKTFPFVHVLLSLIHFFAWIVKPSAHVILHQGIN